MGDLVLTEDEINPVMSKLLAGGIAVTAVHNHLLRAQPATFYMHVDGHGDATAWRRHCTMRLRSATRRLRAAARRRRRNRISTPSRSSRSLGRKGNAVGGVLQFGIPRGDAIIDAACRCRRPWALRTARQFPADRRRQGGDHGRLRAGGEGGGTCARGTARCGHRGHGAAQPHAGRSAAARSSCISGRTTMRWVQSRLAQLRWDALVNFQSCDLHDTDQGASMWGSDHIQ